MKKIIDLIKEYGIMTICLFIGAFGTLDVLSQNKKYEAELKGGYNPHGFESREYELEKKVAILQKRVDTIEIKVFGRVIPQRKVWIER